MFQAGSKQPSLSKRQRVGAVQDAHALTGNAYISAGLGVRRPSAAFCAQYRQSSRWRVLSRRILNFRRRHSGFAGHRRFSRCFRGGFRLNGRLRFGRGNFRFGQNQNFTRRINCGGRGFAFRCRFFPDGFLFWFRRTGQRFFGRVHPAIGKFKDVTLMHQPVQIGNDNGLFRRRLIGRGRRGELWELLELRKNPAAQQRLRLRRARARQPAVRPV